jgi:signal transduction histidine kinase
MGHILMGHMSMGHLGPEHRVFLISVPVSRTDRRLALTVVGFSLLIFLLLAPFARQPLAQVWAFIPAYESALAISDLATAVILFIQFYILRSRAALVLAAGYLFAAFMIVPHALTFPGVFSPTGLLGAGPQSTAWLYIFWHGAFPLAVIGYARLRRRENVVAAASAPALLPVALTVIGVLAAAICLTVLATVGDAVLPPLMSGNQTRNYAVISIPWILSFIALLVLWFRAERSVLDLWLMVVMCAWMFDIALSAVLNTGRFDLGFYAGRAYGLLAATFVLVVLLFETGALYAELTRLFAAEQEERRREAEQSRRLLETSLALEGANRELEAFSYSAAHDLRAPLRAVSGFSEILLEDYGHKLDDDGRQHLRDIQDSARTMARLIDDLLSLARVSRAQLHRQRVDLSEIARAVAARLRDSQPERKVEFAIAEGLGDEGDAGLLSIAIENLIGNAWKYSSKRAQARIEMGMAPPNGHATYFIRDNGAGFDMAYYSKLFGVFQRLHSGQEFEGTGIGLATVQRIIRRHGGRIWAEAEVDHGATFFFTLTGEVPGSDTVWPTVPAPAGGTGLPN